MDTDNAIRDRSSRSARLFAADTAAIESNVAAMREPEVARPAGLTATSLPERCQVLAGVDGSISGFVAAEQAALEADMRGWPLRIVRVASRLRQAERSRDVLGSAVTRAREVVPSLTIHADEVPGSTGPGLIELSEHVGLIVVGRHGDERIPTLVRGSIASQLATRAGCPVLVSRGSSDADNDHRSGFPLVVGVDGSSAAEAAFVFALSEARLRGVGVVAVHAAARRYPTSDPLCSGVLADVGDSCMGVQVHRRRIHKDPRDALRDLSVHASALVVGARGRGGTGGIPTGRVTPTLLRDAYSSVFVVHDRTEVPWPSDSGSNEVQAS